MATVAESLVATLAAAGVKRIYGIVGDSLNGIIDEIRKQKTIEWVHVRHEEVAAFAAGADAHVTGDLAVCAGSSTPAQMPRALETAMTTAIARRGVAVIVLSGDVALQSGEHLSAATYQKPATPLTRPLDHDLDRLAQLLNDSDRVTLLCGSGCAGAHDELLKLGEILKAPMVHALRGKEYVEYDNPYDVGMTGLIGFSSGYYAMLGCDVLLMLGTDFPYRQFYPTDAKIVQIDIRGEKLGNRAPLTMGLVGDVKSAIAALLPRLSDKSDRTFLDKALRHYQASRKELDDLAVGHAGHKPIHPQYLTKMLSDAAAEDAIFTCDVGTPSI